MCQSRISRLVFAFAVIAFVCRSAVADAADEPIPSRVDVEALFRALKAAKLGAKGAEEKTVDYEARAARFQFKGLTVAQDLMIVFRPSQVDSCAVDLDPDHDSYSFRCDFAETPLDQPGIVIPTVASKPINSKYVGANAFNRSVVVSRQTIKRAGLLLRDAGGHYAPSSGVSIDMQDVKVTSGSLRRAYDQLEVGLALRLAPPFVGQALLTDDATISDPNEWIKETDLVVGVPYAAFVFQGGSSRPIARFKVDWGLDLTGTFRASFFRE